MFAMMATHLYEHCEDGSSPKGIESVAGGNAPGVGSDFNGSDPERVKFPAATLGGSMGSGHVPTGQLADMIQGNLTWQTALAQLQKQPLYVLQIPDFGVILTSFSATATSVTVTGCEA